MNYWLVKSEPVKYPFEQLVADGETIWDGVRNYAARNNLRAMKKGDLVLYYHSNEGLCIVGTAKVSKEAFQDPGTNEDWSAVCLKPFKKFKTPVTLAQLKADKRFATFELIRLSRLSVAKVTPAEFDWILTMGN
ncbi:MAG: EVE domain-containing protein [Bacteroidia bacterium]|nr:EVE domain-containing protein [Bacteroidia bacterium]